MKLWIDAQLSPKLAQWLSEKYAVEASPVRRLGLHDATDDAIFDAARNARAAVKSSADVAAVRDGVYRNGGDIQPDRARLGHPDTPWYGDLNRQFVQLYKLFMELVVDTSAIIPTSVTLEEREHLLLVWNRLAEQYTAFNLSDLPAGVRHSQRFREIGYRQAHCRRQPDSACIRPLGSGKRLFRDVPAPEDYPGSGKAGDRKLRADAVPLR